MTSLRPLPAIHGQSLSTRRVARFAPVAVWMGCVLGMAAGCTESIDSEDVASAGEAIVSENGLSTNGLSTNGLSTNGLSTNGLSTNGLSTNGLSTNGLSTNGLSTNGLSTNGLSTNGLSTNGFSAWFDSNPATYSGRVMEYVVRCALAEGETRTFVSSAGVHYTWTGLLGLAPSWAAGNAIPLAEQQLVSACLAAHANKFGLHVDISVRGRKADGSMLPVTKDEKKTFKFAESCFFGNLFADEGVFAVPLEDEMPKHGNKILSSPRACGVVEPWGSADCAPYLPRLAGEGEDYCAGWSGANGTFESCTLGGVTYKPLTTNMNKDDLFECGDGVCQITEVPYSASKHAGCGDCGTVP